MVAGRTIDDKRAFFSAIILIAQLRPYFVWSFVDIPAIKILLIIFLFILLYPYVNKKNNLIALFFILSLVIYTTFSFTRGRSNINGMISSSFNILLLPVVLCKRDFVEKIMNYFVKILMIFLSLSVFFWLLGYFMRIPSLGTIEVLGRTYSHYPFYVVENTGFSIPSILRFSGPFNEPGVVGTLCGLLLCIYKFDMRILANKIFCISGILSFSLFFYLLIFGYLLYYLVVIKKNFIYAIVLVVLVSFFYIKTKDNPILYEYIWQRVEWNDDSGRLTGDNRSNDYVDNYLETIRGTSDYYFGTSNQNWYEDIAGGESATYKSIICIYGMIFFVSYLLVLFSIGAINIHNKRILILFLMIVLSNFYQRSSVFSPPVLFLYTAMACMLEEVRYYTSNEDCNSKS